MKTEITREQKKDAIFKKIKKDVAKLRKLGYTFSDRDSVICLFDDRMYEKDFNNLSNDELSKTIVGILN